MRKLTAALLAFFFTLCLATAVYATDAGTCAITYDAQQGLRVVKWAWTVDGSGDGTGTEFTTAEMGGMVIGALFIPGASVSDLYDVTIKDENGIDILTGVGANLSSTAPSITNYKSAGDNVMIWETTLVLTVDNAGVSKSGTAYLFLKMP